MHACMHAYVPTYLPTYLHTYTFNCVYIYIYIFNYIYIYIYIHTYIYIYLKLCNLILHLHAFHERTYVHECSNTCKNTFIVPKPVHCVGKSVPAALTAATYFVVCW